MTAKDTDIGVGDVGAAGREPPLHGPAGVEPQLTGPLPAGYRVLDADELYGINQLKALEASVIDVIQTMMADKRFDGRALAIARTEIQTGFMWLVRAVARPK